MRQAWFRVVAGVTCLAAALLIVRIFEDLPSQRDLDARERNAPFYTVQLVAFPDSDSNLGTAASLMTQERVMDLAGENELRLLAVSEDRVALCVGRFEEADSPELLDLHEEFRDYADGRRRPFKGAAIRRFPR
ncbi:MAG: hypothetical protein ACYS8L_03770 [Planctomycetota bacterium]|jgi:hypothetical protein